MADASENAFKKLVKADFTNKFTAPEIIKKYGIKDKADAAHGKPSRATLYNWIKEFKAPVSKTKPKAVKLDKTPEVKAVSGPETANPPPKTTINTPKIESNAAPEIPPEKPAELPPGATPPTTPGQINSEYKQYIRFDIFAEQVPDMFEKALKDRGAPLETINYVKFKNLQKETTPLIIQKYMPFYTKWALEINFIASYVVPPVALGLIQRGNANKQAQQKQEQQQVQQPQQLGYIPPNALFNGGINPQQQKITPPG